MEEQSDSNVCPFCLQDPQANGCPQCRRTSSSGTDPEQSVLSIAERLERTDLQTGEGQAEAADVEGDACAVRKERAMNSCLGCLASSSIHTDLSTGGAQLPEDNTRIQVKVCCSQHDKPLEVYCRTDQQCICFLCLLDDHKGHDAVSLATGRAEKQRRLEETKKKVADRETELHNIKKSTDILENLNQATEEECDRIFTELMDFIQTSHTETITLLQNHTRVEMERIHGHVDGLEDEISELKRKHSELDQLSHTDDHISYLQKIQTYRSTSQHEDFSSLTINPHFSFGEIIKSLSSLTAQIQDTWRSEICRIFSAVQREQILLPAEPKTRQDFLKFLVPLSLDPNTAHRNLCLTEHNRTVVCSTEPQSYPEHPDRFQWWAQVLTNEGLTGRCYWEVVWTGLHGVDIAVAYKDIRRTGDGDDSGFGYNKYSWSLDCSLYRCALVHNNTETEISGPVSNRIGVYLEHRAGILSFYSITDTMKLLHRVHNRFTQPIYPGFGLFQGSTAKFCGPE